VECGVLQALVSTGHVGLAVVAVVFSLIGAFYYLRVVRLMYFDKAEDIHPIKPAFDFKILMGVNGLAVLALGIMPQPLMAMCLYAVEQSL
jgi:NADH-quinone oxidoreductase subunit N